MGDVASIQNIDPMLSVLPSLESELNRNLQFVIEDTFVRDSEHSRQFQLARQGLDGAEHTVASLLVEDMNNDNRSYIDFLVFIHKEIQINVSNFTYPFFFLVKLNKCADIYLLFKKLLAHAKRNNWNLGLFDSKK